jgi:putative transposase
MVKNEYKHFNPSNYRLDVKIATVRSSFHCKHNINYHIIWIPKFRKKILTGKVADVLKQIIEGQCQEMQCEKLALEVMPDHIHLFIGAKPTHRPCDIIHKLKGNTSIQLRRVFPNLKYLGYSQHYGKGFDALWATGYYCGSAGHVSADAVARYIAEQQGKDVFEYSIFGDKSGQSKIGDFA